MNDSPNPWRTADKAYQAHHGMCPQCRAAGLNPGGTPRCSEGAGLWAAYQEAGDPPHFLFLRSREAAGRPLDRSTVNGVPA